MLLLIHFANFVINVINRLVSQQAEDVSSGLQWPSVAFEAALKPVTVITPD
jgi:hypothetical protein